MVIALATWTALESVLRCVTDAIELPSCGLQTNSAFSRQDERLYSLESHDLTNLGSRSVQERTSVLRSIGTEPRYFGNGVLLCFWRDRSADNHSAHQLAADLCSKAKAMAYNLIVMPVYRSHEQIGFF